MRHLRLDQVVINVRDDQRIRWPARQGLAICAAAFVASLCAYLLSNELWILACLTGWSGLGIAGSLLALIVDKLQTPPAGALGRVAVEGDKLSIDCPPHKPFHFPLYDVEQGWEEPPDEVVIRTSNRLVISIHVPAAAERRRLLRILGVGADERVLQVPLSSAASQRRGGVVIGVATCLGTGGAFIWAGKTIGDALQRAVHDGALNQGAGAVALAGALTLIALAAVLSLRACIRFMSRRRVVIGTDGLAVEGFGRRRFVPYSTVRRVCPARRGVRLDLAGGELLLPTVGIAQPVLPPYSAGSVDPHHRAAVRRQILVERIREALQLWGRAGVANAKLDRLDRNGRSTTDWGHELHELAAQVADYRFSPLSRDELAAVVADGAVGTERRVAAAYALSGEQDDARRRVQAAVDACADPELQEALYEASEGRLPRRLC